jgi:hypothetical protein
MLSLYAINLGTAGLFLPFSIFSNLKFIMIMYFFQFEWMNFYFYKKKHIIIFFGYKFRLCLFKMKSGWHNSKCIYKTFFNVYID